MKINQSRTVVSGFKWIVSSLAFVLSSQAVAVTDIQLTNVMNCWDYSFAYNAFRIEQSPSRYYVSLSGASLVPEGDFFVSNHADMLSLGGRWSSERNSWHVSFNDSECTYTPSANRLECAAGDLMVNTYDQGFFRHRAIDDLGTIRQITSKFPVQRLELDASPSGLVLKKIHRYPGTGEVVVQVMTVRDSDGGGDTGPRLGCDSDFGEHAPQDLVRYLEGQ